jgi:GNAT superfamily N-acetyltransferase
MESSTPKSKGAEAFSDLVRSRSTRDRISGVEEHDETRGSIAIIEAPDNKAQLRCFLLHPDLRGRSIGKTLVEDAVDFCRTSSYSAIYLWTVSTLVAAARIYRSAGI